MRCLFWWFRCWNMLAGHWSETLWININLRLSLSRRQLSKPCSRRRPTGNWQVAKRSRGNGQPIMIYMLSGILAGWRRKLSLSYIWLFPSDRPWSHPCVSICKALLFLSTCVPPPQGWPSQSSDANLARWPWQGERCSMLSCSTWQATGVVVCAPDTHQQPSNPNHMHANEQTLTFCKKHMPRVGRQFVNKLRVLAGS